MAGETILIVEDNRINRRLLDAVLSPHGYRLLIAVDGEQALDMARAERPDLILMDMQLPVLSGYEATRRLKSDPATRHIFIVAITAHAMEDERLQVMQAGCDAYISKPFDTRAFPGQIRAFLARQEGSHDPN